ncbi:hypothetical protein CEP49_03810 [Mergibacter septicus]|uniref:endonuclease/exonuclease/phosphatase family protein n=1 Tax=Mergibacter septicus TaxID=221402 RepID=UPI0011798498|nr:endonuclease/exonuclease/phosphatase family protein [Mergibacter septicus]AWX13738.1 hypothetical protein CEP49_03810 [Mergibacter septicus]
MRKITYSILILLLFATITFMFPLSKLTIFDEIQFLHKNEPQYIYHEKEQTAFSSRCYTTNAQIPPFTRKQIKFLVWNIHKGQDKGWQQALKQYSHNADFILLQEATNQQNLPFLFSKMYPTQLFASAFSYKNTLSGVAILSTVAPYYYCAGSAVEPWIQIPKVGLAAAYPLINNQSLLVINLHLVNFEWIPTNYRKQLEETMKLITEHQGPIILAGDFNSWNKERLTLLTRLAKHYNLEEVKYKKDMRLKFNNNPLDHIFIRGVNVISATTELTQASDHNPLFITIEIK